MLRAQQLATHRECFSVQRLRTGVVALRVQQPRQVVQAGRHVRMLRAQELATHRQRFAAQRLRAGVVALSGQQPRQSVQAARNGRMLFAVDCPKAPQRLPIQQLSTRVSRQFAQAVAAPAVHPRRVHGIWHALEYLPRLPKQLLRPLELARLEQPLSLLKQPIPLRLQRWIRRLRRRLCRRGLSPRASDRPSRARQRQQHRRPPPRRAPTTIRPANRVHAPDLPKKPPRTLLPPDPPRPAALRRRVARVVGGGWHAFAVLRVSMPRATSTRWNPMFAAHAARHAHAEYGESMPPSGTR